MPSIAAASRTLTASLIVFSMQEGYGRGAHAVAGHGRGLWGRRCPGNGQGLRLRSFSLFSLAQGLRLDRRYSSL
jgi:hypothetical protein